MVERKYGQETGQHEAVRRHLKVVYARQTREKQIFMDKLKEYRWRKDKQMLHNVIAAVGPKWYQALSLPQRNALDNLEFSVYQDLLEGRPLRSAAIMHQLGLVPRPTNSELMNCLNLGGHDPKEVLAQLYLTTYGFPIEGKLTTYCLNAKLMLSGILYLGLDNIIHLLQKKFAPDSSTTEPEPKPKPKPRVHLPSPYLAKMVATFYEPPRIRRKPPLPLPNLDELNEPYEEDYTVVQSSPPGGNVGGNGGINGGGNGGGTSPTKNRLPQSYCDNLVGIVKISPHVSVSNVSPKKAIRNINRKTKSSKSNLQEGHKQKTSGMRKKNKRLRKPVAPTTGMSNAQYTINGVFQVHGKTLFVLGAVSILPAHGEIIHGGYKSVNGENFLINCGCRAYPPPPAPDPCDCVTKWHDTVFEYVKDNKCFCGHRYDYGNEGNFSSEELSYFTKPSRNAPFNFNYETIFDLDPKRLYIEKEFNRIWDTDSMLQITNSKNKLTNDKKKKQKKSSKPEQEKDEYDDSSKGKSVMTKQRRISRQDLDKEPKKDADNTNDIDGTSKVKNEKKKGLPKLDAGKESKKVSDAQNEMLMDSEKVRQDNYNGASNTCLGLNPKPQQYLKCALRFMRNVNTAARLPDLHLVPELKEWMRRRVYGELTVGEKKEYLRKSITYWKMFTSMGVRGFGHVLPPKDPMYAGQSNWIRKQTLNDTFRHYTHRYRLSVFRSHAYVTNLLWRTMCQAEFPDKSFRDVYFSYLFSRLQDLHLLRPYNAIESGERKLILRNKRYFCLPDGYEART